MGATGGALVVPSLLSLPHDFGVGAVVGPGPVFATPVCLPPGLGASAPVVPAGGGIHAAVIAFAAFFGSVELSSSASTAPRLSTGFPSTSTSILSSF